MNKKSITFNSAFETGIRTLVILEANYPMSLDIQRIVDFDYLVVHSGDVNGPESIHSPLPMRAGELLIRRNIINSGILLMMSRGFINRIVTSNGIEYIASESVSPFISKLISPYICELKDRAEWVVKEFGQVSNKSLQEITSGFFDKWTTQFHSAENMSKK